MCGTHKISLGWRKYALVDCEDYHKIQKYRWHRVMPARNKVSYAQTYRNGKSAYMHRMIINAQKGYEVDHINGDGLDNRRKNLRQCKHIENLSNTRKRGQGSSKYKGVHFNKKNGNWLSAITFKGSTYHLGVFPTEQDAARAYNVKAKELQGEFAYLNKID